MINLPPVPEVSSAELARTLEAGDPIQVVDVRAPARVQTGRIDVGPNDKFHNIVGSQLIKYRDLAGTGIEAEIPVAVVCGSGNDSKVLAYHLNNLGCNARSLTGGMSSWMRLTVPRELTPPPSLDRLVQFDRLGKGAVGYLLVSDAAALIIDPPRDVSTYLSVLHDSGADLVGVADTHIHADYISGAPNLARATGVPYYLHPADAVYPYDGTPGRIGFEPLHDEKTIEVGRCTVRVIHTPGHTEGSVTFMIGNSAAVTGDFLFIDSIGRPDLAGKTEEWTMQLWHSVELAKRHWSPDTMVLPAHYASDAERNRDRSIGAPFGKLATENEPLTIADRNSFRDWVGNRSGSFPEAYRKIKAVNVGLLQLDEAQAEELEIGKNECALGGGK
jgi:glyoxylase-like metal-dependent hydrolase (beta-lactamase superfamily II)